ncbi:MAG: restriction endonuclease [Bacteroidota bacterium]|nr:restriction endonuclease [Bacteroidota bacterium]MDP4232284.1 restriction endonuclease [Bacteroidota bacterium]MDP4241423.1 restriction endonuclease [Bacteroidota bacterium]MDP4286753.1 restriction endonuclease [Bacteroidota bacterium]
MMNGTGVLDSVLNTIPPRIIIRFRDMEIPDPESVMLPLLQFMGDGKPHSAGDAETYLADYFRLPCTNAEKPVQLRTCVSGVTTRFKNANLLEPVSRGVFRITARGLGILQTAPAKLDFSDLRSLSSYASPTTNATKSCGQPPNKALGHAYEAQSLALRAEVLEYIRASSPANFEQIILDVLIALGYSSPRAHAEGLLTRQEHGVLEGLVKAHKLGHDAIYLNALRERAIVEKSQVKNFIRTLATVATRKGALITTSEFSPAARQAAEASEKRILLIDGAELARLMVHHGIGVVEQQRYIVKRVDAAYFETDV